VQVNAQLSKRAGERHWHGALPVLAGAAAMAVLAASIGRIMWVAFAALTVAAAGIWALQGPLMSWPAAFLSGTNAASGFALVKMAGSLGSFAGPSLIGALSDAQGGRYAGALFVLAALLAVSGLMLLLFRQPEAARGWLPPFPYVCCALRTKRSDEEQHGRCAAMAVTRAARQCAVQGPTSFAGCRFQRLEEVAGGRDAAKEAHPLGEGQWERQVELQPASPSLLNYQRVFTRRGSGVLEPC
jgi:hypothetical protein